MAAKGPATIEEISDGTGVSRDYIAPLIGLLFYLDITRRSGEKYLLSPSANLHFVTTSNYYQGDVILALAGDQSPWKDLQTYLTRPDKRVHLNLKRVKREQPGQNRSTGNGKEYHHGDQPVGRLQKCRFIPRDRHRAWPVCNCCMPDSFVTEGHSLCKPENADLLHHNISRYGMEERITVSSEEPDHSPPALPAISSWHHMYSMTNRTGCLKLSGTWPLLSGMKVCSSLTTGFPVSQKGPGCRDCMNWNLGCITGTIPSGIANVLRISAGKRDSGYSRPGLCAACMGNQQSIWPPKQRRIYNNVKKARKIPIYTI